MKVQVGVVVISLIAICDSLTPVPGAPVEFFPSLTDQRVTTAVRLINEYYRSRSGFVYPREARRVIRAIQHLVSGVTYKIILLVAGGPSESICQVRYWTKPWFKSPIISSDVRCLELDQSAQASKFSHH